MKLLLPLVAYLITALSCYAQDDVDQLLAESNPTIQNQLKAIGRVYRPGGVSNNVEALREIKKLKELTDDKAELVKQVAIFSVEPEKEMQPLLALGLLQHLELPSRVSIRTLAPYLDTKNPQLRSFVRDWFRGHDNADPGEWAAINYKDYLDYVSWATIRGEEIPAPFVKYIFERSPGQALRVFAYANSHGDVTARLQAIRRSVEARQKGEVPTDRRIGEGDNASRNARLSERREMELAERTVSNAIWLKKNGFADRFQQALPEANEELAKLARRREWWARLYVAYIMRQNPDLRQGDLWELLEKDNEELVREATKQPNEVSIRRHN
jgi:hypothetical protein